MGDPTKAPERIWITRDELHEHAQESLTVPLIAWDFGGEDDVEYVKANLYPGTPEEVGELVEAARTVVGSPYADDRERLAAALAALTAKGK